MGNNYKVLLIKLFIMTAVIISVDAVAGLGLKNIFNKQKKGKYYKVTHAIKNAKEDILIFGSSHASEHFDAPLMQKLTLNTVFNFGNQGQSLLYVYPLVKLVLAYHKPLLIIVNLDYNELQFKSEAYERLSILLPYYHINEVIDSAIALMPYNEDLKCHSFLYRYNSTLGNIMLNISGKKLISNQGYEPIAGNICRVNGIEKIENPTNASSFDQNKIKYLVMLISAAHKANVKLLITTTPIYNYNANQKNIYKEKLRQILNGLDVKYLDYGTNANFKGKCQYFSDDTHLNPQGADKWTTQCSSYAKAMINN
jgi:hypothetical protein